MRFLFWPGMDVLGRIAGFVALAISVVHPSIELWHDFRRQPATEAINTGSDLVMVYDPREKTLDFRFTVVLRNEGTRDDLLSGAAASLEAIEDGNVQVLPTPELALSSEEKRSLRPPFPIAIGSNRLEMSVRSVLGGKDVEVVRAQGERRLRLTLKAQSADPLTLQFCFAMTDPHIFDSRKLQEKTFIQAACP